MENLNQARICVEKTTKTDRKTLNKISLGAQSDTHAHRLRAALYISKLWKPFSTIKISFLDNNNVPRTESKIFGTSVDPLNDEINNLNSIEAVKKVVNERIKPLVNLNIQFVDNPSEGDIRVSFDKNDGAWSTIGTDCFTVKNKEEATLNLGWIDAPTIIHEFMHAIGSMIHEHQNPIGDNQIQWNTDAVYKWASQTQGWDKKTTDENILDHYNKTLINGSNFDPMSIMLYFYPPELTNGQGTKINGRLSGYDVEWLNNMYKQNAPETPENFYQRVYGQSLQSALNNSDKERQKFKSSDIKTVVQENYIQLSSNTDTSIYIICATIFIFLIIIFIIILLLKKNKSYY